MIDLKLIYELYIERINLKLKDILANNVKYTESHNNLKTLLVGYETILRRYTNTTLEDVYKMTNGKSLTKIHFPISNVYVDGKQVNFKALKLYIEKYIWYNNLMQSNIKKLNQHKQELITFELYKRIVTEFNKKVIDKIINDNYLFTPAPSFGSIGVIQNYNERKRPNWGASNKNKAVIIAKGKTPYSKEDAPNGEKWLEYHPFLDFFLHWHTKWISHTLNPFLKDYVYVPARGKKSIVSKLQVVKQDRDFATQLYNRKQA